MLLQQNGSIPMYFKYYIYSIILAVLAFYSYQLLQEKFSKSRHKSGLDI
jgi:hypothetical protein